MLYVWVKSTITYSCGRVASVKSIIIPSVYLARRSHQIDPIVSLGSVSIVANVAVAVTVVLQTPTVTPPTLQSLLLIRVNKQKSLINFVHLVISFLVKVSNHVILSSCNICYYHIRKLLSNLFCMLF